MIYDKIGAMGNKNRTGKNMRKRNLFIPALAVAATLFISISMIPFGKEIATAQTLGENPIAGLFTGPYLKIGTNIGVHGYLTAMGAIRAPVFDILSQGFRGRIYTTGLTQERRYVFPDLSGEICLATGNCSFAPEGTLGRIAKFTETGLGDSPIIDRDGNIGIANDNPLYRLHVSGKIQASDDICTALEGGLCLSSLTERESISNLIIDGEGKVSYIPVWRSDNRLGDSIIHQSDGNIGIGVIPTTKLDIAGTARMLGFRLPVNPEKGYGLMSDERGFGTWRPVLTPEGTAADVAERFSIDPKCKILGNCPEPGDLVSVTEGGIVRKSSKRYDPNLMGIVSTEPELTLNAGLDPSLSRPIALIGRVPTKVSLENGPISAGDLLTSSSVPGAAMKATGNGRVVGMALESSGSASDTIDVLINPHHFGGDGRIIDEKTGESYCLKISDGELSHSLCE